MTASFAFIATCDLVAAVRGRAIRADELAGRAGSGVGWVPADLALTSFGAIGEPNPFGSIGDLRLVPDESSRITLPASPAGTTGLQRPPTELVLATIAEIDGRSWRSCPRTALIAAIADLERRGIRLKVAFEQEFQLEGLPGGETPPFSVEAHRRAEPFGSALGAALADNGLEPETWLPEYGADQYEITVAATDPLRAADRAILVRTLVRDVASAHGLRATFVPLRSTDAVGNGVHVHLSLWDPDGRPRTIASDGSLTQEAGAFAAGILAHAAALVAWTAPSPISGLRLGPHRWSAAAGFLGRQNREAMLRLAPAPTLGGADPAAAANLEYRACDATANPWLVLAALIRAGLAGLDGGATVPPLIEGELGDRSPDERAHLGITDLPRDVESALAALEADPIARGWFDADLVSTHVAIRRTEERLLAGLDDDERCERFSRVL